MTLQVIGKLSNRHSLCIGEVTSHEAALSDNDLVDGTGSYLIKVCAENPLSPGEVLAKFTSESAAMELAQFFRMSGRMERA